LRELVRFASMLERPDLIHRPIEAMTKHLVDTGIPDVDVLVSNALAKKAVMVAGMKHANLKSGDKGK